MKPSTARILISAVILGTASTFSIIGTAEAASFKNTMKKHEAEFRACYQDESAHLKRRISGRVNLHVTVDKKGHVVDVSPGKNTTRSRALAECLVHKVEAIPFGKRKAAREVFGDKNNRPDGIVIDDDMMARGALTALSQMRVAVGKEVCIATHTNRGSDVLLGYEDKVSTLVIDPSEIVTAMFDQLEALIDKRETQASPILIAPHLNL